MDGDLAASVCIPTRNRAALLQRAVASVRGQTESRIEIVISDNASTDGTPELVTKLAEKDPRVRCIRNAQNLGMVGNWNRCLAEASAPLMWLLSDDDTLAPNAIETGLDLLTRHPEAVMAFGASRHCRDSGEFLRINRPFPEERILSPVVAHRNIWLRNCFQLTHAMFRTEAARKVGGFCDEVGWCADTDFTLRMFARAPIAVTAVEMGTYFVHSGQLTGTDNRQAHEWQCRMVAHIFADVKDNRELAALQPLAEGEYLSRYAIHFAAAALKKGQREAAREFLAHARALGLPSSRRHTAMFYVLRGSLALPGGATAFKSVLAPVLSKVAARYA